jgi:hypothetical protein
MRDYKILDIPNLKDIQNEILSYIPIERVETEGKDIGADANIRFMYPAKDIMDNAPSLRNFFTGLNIDPESLIIGTNLTKPYTDARIHIDDIRSTFLSINIPILNCENTKVYLYNLQNEIPGIPIGQNNNKQRFLLFLEDQCVKVDEFFTDKAYLFNTSSIHKFTNQNPTIRYMLLCRIPNRDLNGVSSCISMLSYASASVIK